jgi:hypothetical protein
MLWLIVLSFIASSAGQLLIHFILRNKRANDSLTDTQNLLNLTRLVGTYQKAVEALPSPAEFERVRSMAESAYDTMIGLIPDAGIKAQRVNGAIVTTGLPGINVPGTNSAVGKG